MYQGLIVVQSVKTITGVVVLPTPYMYANQTLDLVSLAKISSKIATWQYM